MKTWRSRVIAVLLGAKTNVVSPSGLQGEGQMEALEQFSEVYRLKAVRDECGDPIVPGRRSAEHHIFDNGDGPLGVCLLFGSSAKWTFAKRKGEGAGLIVRQDGYGEGTMLFDPADQQAARMALTLTGARIKRLLTIEQKNALAIRLALSRKAA
jgi:hypothetical protein